MGKYRDIMTKELKIRGYSPKTQENYLRCMRDFVKYHMKSPDELNIEDIKDYQLHLVESKKVSYTVFNQSVCAIRFFYKNALQKDWEIKHIPYQKRRKKLPDVLSKEEVQSLINAVEHIKHKAIIQTIYSAGLRLQEAISLTYRDINSTRMSIRIREGKGKKDRYVMLSDRLLLTLRRYWKESKVKPYKYLFPGRDPSKQMHPRSVQYLVEQAGKKAGLKRKATPHLLRHSFGTHLLEDGVNIRIIQLLLGHRSLRTTEIYTHVAKNYINITPSPLDTLEESEIKKEKED
jgi:integrase/recombinase XerD